MVELVDTADLKSAAFVNSGRTGSIPVSGTISTSSSVQIGPNIDAQPNKYGRLGNFVLLGSRLIAIFRVDRPWTEQYLLPLFSWVIPGDAKAVWEGFLWSPRLYQPLLIAFKQQFLEAV